MDPQTCRVANAVTTAASAAPARSPAAARVPCLLLNPGSFENARKALVERAERLARAHGAEVIRTGREGGVPAAIDRVTGVRAPAVLVLAGDGTVQALVDRLATLSPDDAPQLLVLGGGRSNVTAADLGGRGRALAKLEQVLRRWRAGAAPATETRDLVRVAQEGAPARHGFLLTAGWIDYAIRSCHRYRARGGRLRQTDAATLWHLARLALRRKRPALDALRIEANGHEPLPAPAHLLAVTSLQRRQGPFDPFAPRGEGALRFSAVSARGLRFWLQLPAFATGRFGARMQPGDGYLSGRTDALRVLGLSSYTLDGEEFDADPARPVTIRKGPRLTFLVP